MATIAASGPIKFSDIQAVMGGSGAISMSAYAQNSTSYYTRGVSGIPNTGINVGAFLGKARAVRSGLLYRIFNLDHGCCLEAGIPASRQESLPSMIVRLL